MKAKKKEKASSGFTRGVKLEKMGAAQVRRQIRVPSSREGRPAKEDGGRANPNA